MTTPVENFLSRLDKVKQVGRGQWLACCPAHDDKNPSMSISEKNDTFVVCCHTCKAGGTEIMESVGLTASDFYEKQDIPNHIKPVKRKWSARQICEIMGASASNVALLCERKKHQDLTEEESATFDANLQNIILLSYEALYG